MRFRGVPGARTAELTAGGERVWLGTYSSPEEATHAYDAACCFGHRRDYLNFPEVQ
jgi:hypothetical protein